MRNLLLGALLAGAMSIIGAVSAAAQQAAPAQPITLKVAHFWRASALPPTKVLGPWCAKIAAESDGRLACDIYPEMLLGGAPPQLMQQMFDGVADIVWTVPGYTAGRYPSLEAFELPFVSTRAEPTSRALWEYCAKHCGADFKGAKLLALNVHDEGYIHANRKTIKTLADFSGLKIRAPTRTANRLLAQLGATPISLPLPAIPEAAANGVLDGFLLPWEAIPPLGLHRITRFHSETDPSVPALYTTVFVIAMNQARYDSLPPDLQQVIDANAGADFSAAIGRTWDESSAQARTTVAAAGGEFYVIPAEELSKWRTAGDRLTSAWVAEMNSRGRNGQAMLDDARALIARYAQ